jgi:hypothetical protein
VSLADESGVCVAPPGREAQDIEVVCNELKVPKANSFAKGESIACQMFTVGSDGDHR